MTKEKSLLDLTTRDINRFINESGEWGTESERNSNAMELHVQVQERTLSVSIEMLGMGHNEPRSYGPIRTHTYKAEQVFDWLEQHPSKKKKG